MKKYVGKRLLSMVPTLFMISIVIFALMKAMPHDPVTLSMPSSLKPAQYEIVYSQVRERLGLDESLPIQYGKWIVNMMRGDFGTSITYRKPVLEVIKEPLLHTVVLNGIVIVISILISLSAGVYSALHKNSVFDLVCQGVTLLGMSIPAFFIALIFIYLFAFQLQVFPSSGMPFKDASLLDWIRSLFLPVVSMTILNSSGLFRYIRNAMVEELSKEYILAAYARGLTQRRVMLHALRNCMLPMITILMSQISSLFFGSVVIESIFAYDGIGRVLLTALEQRDFMLAIALNMLYAFVYLICNLLSDVLYTIADPRVHYS